MMKKKNILFTETLEHAPFTATATIIGILLFVLFKTTLGRTISLEAFEILHPIHIFFSAMVTAGVFYRYQPKFLKALLVGIFGAFLIGTLSDVIFPYLGTLTLGANIHFHFPILEHPIIILLALLIGAIIGIKTQKTKVPHFAHVFLSVFASLFYITAFATNISTIQLALSFFIIFIAVILPCCISDIMFPTLFLKKK